MNVSRETSAGNVQFVRRIRRTNNDTRYILWHPARSLALDMPEAEALALLQPLHQRQPGHSYEVQHVE